MGEPFISEPERLNELSSKATIASIGLYKHLISPKSLPYLYDSLYYLKPKEVQKDNFGKKEYQEKINQRKCIYFLICALMNIKPQQEEGPSLINPLSVKEE